MDALMSWTKVVYLSFLSCGTFYHVRDGDNRANGHIMELKSAIYSFFLCWKRLLAEEAMMEAANEDTALTAS
jgi:hypothetical protein